MKSKHLYILSVVIFILGAAYFSVYVYKNYIALNEYLVTINMPGEGTIEVEAPGEYDFYYENDGKSKTLLDEEDSIPGFALRVKGQDGKYIPVTKPTAAKKYSYLHRTGTSIFRINPEEAGTYEVTGNYTAGDDKANFLLRYDRGFSDKRSKTAVNAQALFLFPIIVSLLLFLYAYSRDKL